MALSEKLAPHAQGHPKDGARGHNLHEDTSLRACILCITLEGRVGDGVTPVPKSKPFTIRLSEEVGGWLKRENQRTRLPKGALLETLVAESIRTRRFPGIGFRGPEHAMRAKVIGTGLDVWELVELYEGKGKERLLSGHNVSERQLDLSYYEMYPREIDEALELRHRPRLQSADLDTRASGAPVRSRLGHAVVRVAREAVSPRVPNES